MKLLFICLVQVWCASSIFGATPLRWGIASTGRIANDFVNAVGALPNSDHEVVAVAARKLESAQKFANEHNISKAYQGYANLALDPNVDVVYVAVLNPQHYEVTKLLLENGKNVLCEKPFTMNETQTTELLNLAKEKKLFLMEAVWSRCFPVYDELRRILDAGEIGDVKEAYVSFGINLQGVKRITSKELGGGVTLDLGVYVLQLQQYVFRGLKPTSVFAAGHLIDEGTDQSVHAIISYPSGKTAMVAANGEIQLPNVAVVSGTKGTVKIPNFWAPTQLIKNGVTQEFPLIENTRHFNFPNSAGLAYEAEEVRKCIKGGKLESSKITHAETLQLSQLMDTLRKQIGVTE